MTTSTLDLTDLEHLLDGEPGCESARKCDRAAANHVVILCGCTRRLMCQACTDRMVRLTQARLDESGVVVCAVCKIRHPGTLASDVIGVIPL